MRPVTAAWLRLSAPTSRVSRVAFASMIGALILARAVSDDELSDLILKSTAKRVIKRAKVRKAVRSS